MSRWHQRSPQSAGAGPPRKWRRTPGPRLARDAGRQHAIGPDHSARARAKGAGVTPVRAPSPLPNMRARSRTDRSATSSAAIRRGVVEATALLRSPTRNVETMQACEAWPGASSNTVRCRSCSGAADSRPRNVCCSGLRSEVIQRCKPGRRKMHTTRDTAGATMVEHHTAPERRWGDTHILVDTPVLHNGGDRVGVEPHLDLIGESQTASAGDRSGIEDATKVLGRERRRHRRALTSGGGLLGTDAVGPSGRSARALPSRHRNACGRSDRTSKAQKAATPSTACRSWLMRGDFNATRSALSGLDRGAGPQRPRTGGSAIHRGRCSSVRNVVDCCYGSRASRASSCRRSLGTK